MFKAIFLLIESTFILILSIKLFFSINRLFIRDTSRSDFIWCISVWFISVCGVIYVLFISKKELMNPEVNGAFLKEIIDIYKKILIPSYSLYYVLLINHALRIAGIENRFNLGNIGALHRSSVLIIGYIVIISFIIFTVSSWF